MGRLLLVENDEPLRDQLDRGLSALGFSVKACGGIAQARSELSSAVPDFAVVDLKLDDGNGLTLVKEIARKNPKARTVVLTGYGNTRLAVAATKAGAADFMIKPVGMDELLQVLIGSSELPAKVVSADGVWWDHINRIYDLCQHNVSETARRLGMHRRSLQRILSKGPPD